MEIQKRKEEIYMEICVMLIPIHFNALKILVYH